MAERPDITEMQVNIFTYDQKQGTRVSPRHSNPQSHVGSELRKPQKDRILEDALVNNIGISRLLTKRELQILRSILAGSK